jgi:hypothetical protein
MGGDPYDITGRIYEGDNRYIKDILFRGIGRRMVEEIEAFARDRCLKPNFSYKKG